MKFLTSLTICTLFLGISSTAEQERYNLKLKGIVLTNTMFAVGSPLLLNVSITDETRARHFNKLAQARSYGKPLPVYTNKVDDMFSQEDWGKHISFFLLHESSNENIYVPDENVFIGRISEPFSNTDKPEMKYGLSGNFAISPSFFEDKPLGTYKVHAFISNDFIRAISKPYLNKFTLTSPEDSKYPAFEEILKGDFYYWRGMYGEAIPHYEAAAKLNPKYGAGTVLLNAYEKEKRYEDAISLVNKLLRELPDPRGKGFLRSKKRRISEKLKAQKEAEESNTSGKKKIEREKYFITKQK